LEKIWIGLMIRGHENKKRKTKHRSKKHKKCGRGSGMARPGGIKSTPLNLNLTLKKGSIGDGVPSEGTCRLKELVNWGAPLWFREVVIKSWQQGRSFKRRTGRESLGKGFEGGTDLRR